MAETDITGPTRYNGTSTESFADAAKKALDTAPPANHRQYTIESMSIEDGGILGQTQFHVEIYDRTTAHP